MKTVNALKQKNITLSLLYFYVHFITEIICFFSLEKVFNNINIIWMIPLMYDGISFVPQGLIGYYKDKFPKINLGLIGIFMFILSISIKCCFNLNNYVFILLIGLANCCMHIDGATETLEKSGGKLSHPAIFVAGGSFGVIAGKLLGSSSLPLYILLPLTITMIPFVLLGHSYEKITTSSYNLASKKIKAEVIIYLAIFVIIARGFIGYGIPTSWNKTTIQNIIFYCSMGLGKALGGILSDAYSIRKVSFISTICAIPFLIFGDNIMFISIIGVTLFSMTMAITLGIINSCIPKNPGLSFGLTTIGLFLGTVPIFFIKIMNSYINIILICFISIICFLILLNILREDNKI